MPTGNPGKRNSAKPLDFRLTLSFLRCLPIGNKKASPMTKNSQKAPARKYARRLFPSGSKEPSGMNSIVAEDTKNEAAENQNNFFI